MSNERTADGLKPSGQMPDAKAEHFTVDQQQLDIIVKRLCREFELPIYEFKTLDQVIEHLKWRIGRTMFVDSPAPVGPSYPNMDSERQFATLPPGVKKLVPTPMQDKALPMLTEEQLDEARRKLTQHAPKEVSISSFFSKQLEGADAIDAPNAFEILKVCLNLAIFLMRKNKAYGDSALKPLRVMSTADPVEQIRVRMDDKLSRLMRGHAAGEDAMHDLVGYWVLLKVAEAEQEKKTETRRNGSPARDPWGLNTKPGDPGADGFGMG